MQKPKRKVDRRVLRSRRQLSAALIELMGEASFEEITIKDITDRADMNRATFYLHYGTKEELLYKSLESRFDQLVQRIEADISSNPDKPVWIDDCYDQLVFEHVAEHVDLYKVILGSNGFGGIIHQIIDYISVVALRNTVAYYGEKEDAEIPHEVSSRFVAGAMFSLIVWWIRNDMPYSSKEMASMCHRLISKGCHDLLDI